MKILKYKYVKSATFLTTLASIFDVLTAYSLSFLVVSDIKKLIRNLALVAGIYICQSIFLFFQLRLSAQASSHMTQVLNQNIDEFFAQMSFQKFHEKDRGERLSLYINDVPKVIELTLDKFISQVHIAATAIAAFIALINIHYSMGIIAVITFLVMAGLPKLFQTQLGTYISGLQDEKALYTSKARELLQGFTTFFEQNIFSVFFAKSYKATKKYADYQLRTQTFTAFMSACLTVANGLISVISVAIMAYLVIIEQAQAGALLAVVSLIPNFGASVTQLLSEHEFYKSGQALFAEKLSFASDNPNLEDLPGSQLNDLATAPSYTLKTQDIIVNYDKPLTLPNTTFEFGKKYAIVGESGSGKSTLLKILLGEIENYNGKVFVGSQEKLPVQNLFNAVSYVNQETFLFNDTVKNNIDPLNKLSDTQVHNLLEQVGLANISPDQIIQDNGKNLSGGQRQRIAFARALARGKKILILDEATANLDKQTAAKIENLALHTRGTVIMITHHMNNALRHQLDNVIELRSTRESNIVTY
ncbi:ATP-binding cassette domain-containing protein [Alloscardovia venturai]|uniref:ATP-binding cassette domain-containing protein n=1 Tax=Alloscardovia venturai TaxID=1769421 RepID=A0ABW2Y2G8_9BIFI